jgi:hypothetical protein
MHEWTTDGGSRCREYPTARSVSFRTAMDLDLQPRSASPRQVPASDAERPSAGLGTCRENPKPGPLAAQFHELVTVVGPHQWGDPHGAQPWIQLPTLHDGPSVRQPPN